MSIVLHGGLIAALIAIAAPKAAHRGPDKPREEHIVYVAPPPPLPPTPAPALPKVAPATAPRHTAQPAVRTPRPTPTRAPTPTVAARVPVVPDFSAKAAPEAVPEMPDLSKVATANADLAKKASEGLDFSSKKVTTSESGGEVARGLDSGHIYSENTVDEPVVAMGSNPKPEYPPSLRSSGTEADFTVHFVVDSTGRVRDNSLEFPSETHNAFVRVVRGVLLASRYRPARAAGHKVAQLVAQRFSFRLDH